MYRAKQDTTESHKYTQLFSEYLGECIYWVLMQEVLDSPQYGAVMFLC